MFRTEDGGKINQLIDYVQFCGSGATDKDEGISILDKSQRFTAAQLNDRMPLGKFLLVDVRLDTEFEIAALPGTVLNSSFFF